MIKIKLPVDQIVADYESGLSCQKIADKYGVSHPTIRKRLKEAGVQIRPYARKFHGENALPMDEIVADYQRGMSPRKLAEKYGANYSTIRVRLKEAGVYGCAEYQSALSLAKEDYVPIYDEDTFDSICKLYIEEDLSMKQISEKLSVSRWRVRQTLLKLDLPIRSRLRQHTIDWDLVKLDLESGINANRVCCKYNIQREMIISNLGKEYLYMSSKEEHKRPEIVFKKRTYPKTTRYKERQKRNLAKRSVQVKSLSMAMERFEYYKQTGARVLCMPGKNCWDIRYFKSKDTVSEIVAIEKDLKTFEQIKKKHNDVEVHHTSTSCFFSSYEGKCFDIIYLDYYSCFTSSVELDLLLIFEKKILSDKGTIVINFFAGRESEQDQIRHKRHFDNLMRLVPQDVDWDSLHGNLKRVNAFNGFLAKYRRSPLFPSPVKRKMKKGPEYANCTRPFWYCYKTLSGKHDMITGVFKVTYENRGREIHTKNWVIEGEKQFKHNNIWVNRHKYINRVSTNLPHYVSGSDMVKSRGEAILDFYNKHHYTPTRTDLKINVKSISEADFNDIVVGLGLLVRRRKYTDEELLSELRRINEREGCVNQEHLQRANIVSKRKNLRTDKMCVRCIALCEQEGFIEGISLRKIRNAINRYNGLKGFLEHLKGGGLKSNYTGRKLVRVLLKGCSDESLRAEQLLKETKEYLDLINVVY